MKYYRTADDALYESIRQQLDAAWWMDVHGCTCISPASAAPRDSQGRIVLAVDDEFAEFDAVKAVLPGLLQAGIVAEIDRATYMAAITPEEI